MVSNIIYVGLFIYKCAWLCALLGSYLVDKLMVEVWHLQLSQASLGLLAVPRQEILLQQQVHLIAQNHQDEKHTPTSAL